MLKICFVCLGNICRSPMAEFIMKNKIKNLNLEKDFYITSKATSREESGNDIYPLAKKTLQIHHIPYQLHSASTIEASDYQKFDLFIGMDINNINTMKKLFDNDSENKVYRLLDFTKLKKDIDDPWYTRDFEKSYQEIDQGCTELLNILKTN